jgi:hypothetical protein
LIFTISTTGLNLVLTGIIALGGSGGAADTMTSLVPENKAEIAAVEEIIVPEAQPAIAADSTVKLSFSRSEVKTIPAPPKVDPLIAVASADPESQISKNFDVLATIQAARSEIGKSFPTGWNQPGECLVAAKRWIRAGKGNWYGAGTPIGNYKGAKEVEYKNAAPGDIIQYLSPTNPAAWVSGVHTILVTKNNGDGTLQIIEANNPGGSGHVSENLKWTPKPPNGVVMKIFRF